MSLELVLILCIMGCAFLLPAIIIGITSHKKLKNCTSSATATVVDIRVNYSDDTTSYHPVYKYQVGGTTYTSVGAYLSGHVPEKGSNILIMYNPDKPKQSYIVGYDTKVFKILTIVFGIVGMIPILICIGLAIYHLFI